MALGATKDLTAGKPMKLVLGFAFPLLFGFLFQQLYNVVDTAIVGRYLGARQLSAVGSTGSVNFMVLGLCMGICSGFSIPVAQCFGAGDFSKMRKYVNHAVRICAGISLFMGLLTALLCQAILRAMNTPEDIIGDAIAYIRIIFAAIPVTVMYNMGAGILRSLGDSRTPVIFLIMASLINVVLDLFFILVLKMGVVGAAVATAISQLCSGVACVLVLMKKFRILKSTPQEKAFDARHAKHLLGIGLPMGLQFSITALGAVVLQFSVNGLGSVAVAAVTAGGKVSQFCTCVYDALATTMATYAGQNVGAGKLDRVHRGLLATTVLGTVYTAVITAVIWIFGRNMLSVFLDTGETRIMDMAVQYMRANSSLYFFLLLVNIVRLSIQGMGYTRVAMIAGVLEMIARALFGMVLVPLWGYDTAVFANPAAWIAADIFLIPCYFSVMKKLRMKLGHGLKPSVQETPAD